MARLLTRMDQARYVSGLVERARRGDASAEDELVRALAPEVYGLLFRIAGNHEDAEDLAQETFVRALRSLDLFRGEGRFAAWVARIAVHVGRDHLRRRRRAPEVASREGELADPRAEAPSVRLDRRELRLSLAAALERLPEPQRTAFALRVLDGREYDEVAALLGVRAATARTQVMHARRALERWLAPWLGRVGR